MQTGSYLIMLFRSLDLISCHFKEIIIFACPSSVRAGVQLVMLRPEYYMYYFPCNELTVDINIDLKYPLVILYIGGRVNVMLLHTNLYVRGVTG